MATSSSESGTHVYKGQQLEHPALGRMRAHDIFLSHSGAQKGFVKDLHKMLSPQYITFLDITHHSLPLTERFPDRIFDAAQSCKLAVVVLSNEFLRSKWPMLELCAFVKAPSVKILPLFYKLSPTDLKDKVKRKEWLKEWEVHADHDGRIEVSSCEKALRKLCSLNGLVFQETEGEQSYLQEIMSSIWREILPRAVKYEESGIHGKDRLCKILLAEFEALEKFGQPTTSQLPPQKKVHVLGMHGPSGGGKSTLARCFHQKLLINFEDKAHYLELPTNPSNADLVQTCKDLLNFLTNGFYSAVHLKQASKLREMYQLFKGSNLRGFKVFLILDNISTDKDSIEMVQVILRLCVGPGSKVLLVARTYNVLRQCQDKLAESYVCDTIRVPSLNEEEAINVLLQHAGGVGFDTSDGPEKDLTPRYKEIMEKVVRMSGFGDPKNGLIYLPLVLNIMGHSLRESRLDQVLEWGVEMGIFWRRVEGCKKDAVRQLVQESFNKLSLELQLLFLDLALFYIPVYGHSCIKEASALISLMHECSPEEIQHEMYSLERSCFLSMQDKYFDGGFCVHDVFLEFAASIPQSSMYYLSHKRNIDAKGADEGLRKCDVRVIVLELDEECTRLDFPMSLSSVKILSVRNSKALRVLGLAGLTSLVSLEIVNCPNIERIELVDGNVHNHLQSLGRFRWSNSNDQLQEQHTNISVTAGQWW